MKILGNSKTIQEAAEVINKMKRYKPYEWGGKWFVIQKQDDFCGYRSKASAIKNCTKEFPNLWEVY